MNDQDATVIKAAQAWHHRAKWEKAAREHRNATIREAHANGMTAYRIARLTGLTPQAIANIIKTTDGERP